MTGLTDKIQNRGYYLVKIRPRPYEEARLSDHGEIKDTLDQQQVSLRGWNYPPVRHRDLKNHEDHVFANVEYSGHNEHFRLYKSGQFAHIRGFWEDWREERDLPWRASGEPPEPGEEKWVLELLYTVTEIHEFAKRLATQFLPDSVDLRVELHGIKNRRLVMNQSGRWLRNPAEAAVEDWGKTWTHQADDLLAAADEKALDAFLEALTIFNYDSTDPQVWEKDQEKFLDQRR